MDGMRERKMTAEERGFLLRAAKYVGAGSIPDVRGLVALGVLLGAGAGYFRQQHVTAFVVGLAALAGLVFLFAIVLVIAGSREGSARKRTFASDVANGVVRETALDVVDAIRIGDENRPAFASWCLNLADGRVLFLEGAIVAAEVERGEFPSSLVTPAWAPGTDVLISVRCDGAPFAPSVTIPKLPLKKADGFEVRSGTFLKLDFAKLKAKPT